MTVLQSTSTRYRLARLHWPCRQP